VCIRFDGVMTPLDEETDSCIGSVAVCSKFVLEAMFEGYMEKEEEDRCAQDFKSDMLEAVLADAKSLCQWSSNFREVAHSYISQTHITLQRSAHR
jgi:hypothetical protein